jgi:hypothetical protein
MSYKRITFPTRIMEKLKDQLSSKAEKQNLYIADILEAGAITVLKWNKKQIIGAIEDYKGAK